MSPKSRTRKSKSTAKDKKRRTGPHGNPVAELYRHVAPQFEEDLDGTSSLFAEVLASSLYAAMHESTNLGPGIDIEMFHDWLHYVESRRERPAAAMLWAMSHVADPPADAEAAAAAQRLTDLGIEPPAWLAPLRKLEATEAWMLTDVYGDFIELVIEFRTGRRKHGMSMRIDTNHMGGYATSVIFDDSARKLLKAAERFARHMDELMHVKSVDLAEARRLGITAIDATDITSDPDLDPGYEQNRALALKRLLALPDNGVVALDEHRIPSEAEERAQIDEDEAESEQLVARFMAHIRETPAHASVEQFDEQFARLADLAIMYGRDYDDGRLLRVSPPKINNFAGWFLPRKVMLDEKEREALPPFLDAWIAWCAAQQQLSQLAVDLVLHSAGAAVDAVAKPEENGEDFTSPGMAFLEGVDLETLEEAQDLIERRQLAMPYFGTRIGAEDYPRLNPNRPDELRLLVLGELSELHGVGQDEYPRTGEPDGSPVWNAALRERVVSQLWQNEPPQVWEAAQRLQAQGLDRAEILDRLQGALSGHIDASKLQRASAGSDTAVHTAGYLASLATLGAKAGKGGHLRSI